MQTYHNYEVIIVDDGSDDFLTMEVLANINYPNVTVLHKTNGHVSSARNHGIKASTGEYILTLDSDDMFEPTFLEKAVKVLENQNEIGVVTCYAYRFNQKGKIGTSFVKGGEIKDFLARNNCLASALFFYHCWEEAGGYNENLRNGCEDWDFWLSVTSAGWKVYSIPEFLYWYRKMPDSMYAQSRAQRPETIKQIVKKHEEVYRLYVVDAMYQKELRNQSLINKIIGSNSYKIGNIICAPLKALQNLSLKKGSKKTKPVLDDNRAEKNNVLYESIEN